MVAVGTVVSPSVILIFQKHPKHFGCFKMLFITLNKKTQLNAQKNSFYNVNKNYKGTMHILRIYGKGLTKIPLPKWQEVWTGSVFFFFFFFKLYWSSWVVMAQFLPQLHCEAEGGSKGHVKTCSMNRAVKAVRRKCHTGRRLIYWNNRCSLFIVLIVQWSTVKVITVLYS